MFKTKYRIIREWYSFGERFICQYKNPLGFWRTIRLGPFSVSTFTTIEEAKEIIQKFKNKVVWISEEK